MQLNCYYCSKEFSRRKADYNRQIKIGKIRFFCSLNCCALQRNKDFPPKGNIENLDCANKKDEFTKFRWFILRAKARNKIHNYGFNLTLEHLKLLWEIQNGVCPFTGVNLRLPINTGFGFIEHDPYNASLDRIDNSKGYIEGNVRFISVMANFARNNFSDDQLIKFCEEVYLNRK